MQKIAGFVVLAILVVIKSGEARYRTTNNANIPQLLDNLYSVVGQDRFRESWKEFNSRNSDHQDEFLMADMSDEELSQLGDDFERLSGILATDPMLVDLYADFEHNLDTNAFLEMDQRLSQNHTWWGRIKKFLYKKLEKLADEVYRKEHSTLQNHL